MMIPEETGLQLEHIGQTIVFVLIILLIVLIILLFPLLISKAARNKGRNGLLWFFFALFATPFVAGFFLLVLGDSKHKWERDIIQQEKLMEQYHEQRRLVEAKAKIKQEKTEMKHRMKMDRKLEKASIYQSGMYQYMQNIASAQEKKEDKETEKPSIENDYLKKPTTDHSRYMPH